MTFNEARTLSDILEGVRVLSIVATDMEINHLARGHGVYGRGVFVACCTHTNIFVDDDQRLIGVSLKED